MSDDMQADCDENDELHIAQLTAERDALREQLKLMEADAATDFAAHVVIVEGLKAQVDRLRAELESVSAAVNNGWTEAHRLGDVLRELSEAGQRMLRVFDEFADMVVPTPETAVYAPPLGEATEVFRAVLAKVRPT